jgi:RNA polymerase sigma-70 factor (ECF subfamily)
MIIPMPQLNNEAFEQTAWPHRPALQRLAVRLARNSDDADDLVQDTFIRAFRAFHTFQPGTNVRAWLFQILRHVFINRYRAERGRPFEVAFESVAENRIHDAAAGDPRGCDPESIVMSSDLSEELRRALAELPQPFRETVTCAWLDELSYREISERLSVPIGTVMSRIHRGRRMLQESLREFGAARRLVVAEGDDRQLVA